MRELLPVHKNGQSLIEVLVSMTVAILVITGLVGAVLVAIRNTQFAKNQSLATKYAQEGLEAVRTIRDRDWTLLVNGTYGLQFSGSQWSFSGASDTPASTRFFREIFVGDVTPLDTNKKKVTAKVSWTDGSGTHKSELVSYFTKSALWR